MYDVETGLSYLRSRYYNPEIMRFANADSYITGNTYEYCKNDPILFMDLNGYSETLSADSLGIGLSAIADVATSLLGLALKPLSGVGIFLYILLKPTPTSNDDTNPGIVFNSISPTTSIPSAFTAAKYSSVVSRKLENVKVDAIPALPVSDTQIFRYGGTNPGNLVPRAKDLQTGLSFSTIPAPGAATTTIEEVNATGILIAIKDGLYHVSVRPTNGSIREWYEQGTESEWTLALKGIVRKWY